MYFTTGRGNQSALNTDPLGTLNEPLPGDLGNTGTGAFILGNHEQANTGNNDRHFWGSSEHKSFKDQGNLRLKHIMVKVGLLMENKGIVP